MARLVFLGTPISAVEPLRTLVADGHQIDLVVTRPDKRRGRGAGLVPSAVKAEAERRGLTVTDTVADALGPGAELGVVVAYGRIIPASVLDELPMVNLHFSLLPRWRGAAPVERAILEGDSETGVCLMEVAPGLDTGGIYAERVTPIDPEETADELRSRLVSIGCGLLSEYLKDGRAGLPVPRDQSGSPSYAEKLLPGELEIRWDESAERIHRVIRLGRAWTPFRGRRLRILRARASLVRDGEDSPSHGPGELHGTDVSTGDGGSLSLIEVQPEGRRPMTARDWRHGVRPRPGERLGV